MYRAHAMWCADVKRYSMKSLASCMKSLAKVIDKEGNYTFRPNVSTPLGIHKIRYFEEISLGISLSPRASVSMEAKLLLGVAAPSLLTFKLEWKRKQQDTTLSG